ncbi:MAG: enoyl-CoA hydratase/isomerase family protein, partial [Chloroflexota bacterium]
MDYRNIILEKRQQVAWVTMNRPDALNALNDGLIADLLSAIAEIQADEKMRLMVLRGAGRAFCSGADLKNFAKEGGYHFGGLVPAMEAIAKLDKPVIAAVHGYAVTGGFYLAVACDLVVAEEGAEFMETHARWGLVPRSGEAQMLNRLLGPMKAKQVVLTSDRISAEEARQLGLVYRVAPKGKLEAVVEEVVAKLLGQSQFSLAGVKTLMNQGVRA